VSIPTGLLKPGLIVQIRVLLPGFNVVVGLLHDVARTSDPAGGLPVVLLVSLVRKFGVRIGTFWHALGRLRRRWHGESLDDETALLRRWKSSRGGTSRWQCACNPDALGAGVLSGVANRAEQNAVTIELGDRHRQYGNVSSRHGIVANQRSRE
jgi:hypothetical protein